MSDDEKQAILEELDALCPAPRPMQPGDILTQDVQTRFGIGRAAAGAWLDRHVEAGHLIATDAIDAESGRRVKVYRKVEV